MAMPKSEFYAKLDVFVKRLQDERNNRDSETTRSLNQYARENGREGYHKCGYDEGQRFVRVWDESGTSTEKQKNNTSVAYFVEKDTGVIYGAKGWKAYNPNRAYGTLDEIDQWDWSEYYATNKNGLSTLVPKFARR